MSSVRTTLAFASLALAATYTLAQTNPATRLVPEAQAVTPQGQAGFFKPAPDGNPSITRPTPPAPSADQAAEARQGGDRVIVQPVVVTPPAPAADPATEIMAAEAQAVLAEREARMRAAAGIGTPINGAFTGSTNERDR